MDATVFSDSEKTDIRRFMGYPPIGTDANTITFGTLINQPGVIEHRLDRLTETEGDVVRSYLKTLITLEKAIITAAGNLEDDKLGPLVRNRHEIADRQALFADWRRRLCAFLGFPPGAGLRSGGGMTWVI